jgi:hypothetical protein
VAVDVGVGKLLLVSALLLLVRSASEFLVCRLVPGYFAPWNERNLAVEVHWGIQVFSLSVAVGEVDLGLVRR